MCSALTAAILHGNYHASDAWFLVLSFSLNSKKVIAYNFLCLWLLVGPISLNHEIPFTLMIPPPPPPTTYPTNCHQAFWSLGRTLMVDALPLMYLEIIVNIVFTFISYLSFSHSWFIRSLLFHWGLTQLCGWNLMIRSFTKQPRADVPRKPLPTIKNCSLPQAANQRRQCI